MKNTFKILGILVTAALFAFSFAACDNYDYQFVIPPEDGNWTIPEDYVPSYPTIPAALRGTWIGVDPNEATHQIRISVSALSVTVLEFPGSFQIDTTSTGYEWTSLFLSFDDVSGSGPYTLTFRDTTSITVTLIDVTHITLGGAFWSNNISAITESASGFDVTTQYEKQ